MAEHALGALDSRSAGVTRRALENAEVCKQFMGFVARCTILAVQKGKGYEGITVGPVQVSGNRFRAHVTFWSLPLVHQPGFLASVDGLLDYMKTKAQGMALVIERNPEFFKFLDDLVGKLDQYAAHKGKRFEDIRFSKAIIDETDTLVLEVEQ